MIMAIVIVKVLCLLLLLLRCSCCCWCCAAAAAAAAVFVELNHNYIWSGPGLRVWGLYKFQSKDRLTDTASAVGAHGSRSCLVWVQG